MTIRRDKRLRQTFASQSISFPKFARNCVQITGHPLAFSLAIVATLAWAATGPVFKFSDTWQLAINTGTTIITFLMVFLIQNAQNHDREAIQLQLAELIRATQMAHNTFPDIERLSEANPDQLVCKTREDPLGYEAGQAYPGLKSNRDREELRWRKDMMEGRSVSLNRALNHQT